MTRHRCSGRRRSSGATDSYGGAASDDGESDAGDIEFVRDREGEAVAVLSGA